VLVNRGFVPPDRKRQGVCQSGSNKRVTITGLVRASEPHGGFLRTNDARADRWYSRDVQAIGRSRSLQHLAPVFIDADAAPTRDGYPVGGLTVVTFRNAHLAYALTWFALAAMSAAGAVVLLKSKGR
jgi:surfeit locus 1 family protein